MARTLHCVLACGLSPGTHTHMHTRTSTHTFSLHPKRGWKMDLCLCVMTFHQGCVCRNHRRHPLKSLAWVSQNEDISSISTRLSHRPCTQMPNRHTQLRHGLHVTVSPGPPTTTPVPIWDPFHIQANLSKPRTVPDLPLCPTTLTILEESRSTICDNVLHFGSVRSLPRDQIPGQGSWEGHSAADVLFLLPLIGTHGTPRCPPVDDQSVNGTISV